MWVGVKKRTFACLVAPLRIVFVEKEPVCVCVCVLDREMFSVIVERKE